MNESNRTAATLAGLAVCFLALTGYFLLNLGGRPELQEIPLVDISFTNRATARMSAAETIRTGGDASGQDCYACHERDKPPKLKFNPDQSVINAKEHMDIVMGHGTHGRNNNCFNCHNETNLELLQTRDGKELKLVDSVPLCGSCHGPTYRDWEAGSHGRTSGYWKRDAGPVERQQCVSCHDPHTPKFKPWKPAPGPHTIRSDEAHASSGPSPSSTPHL